MIKVCSKCKKEFNCNANYIDKCWCVKIKVIKGTLEKINKIIQVASVKSVLQNNKC